MKKIAIIGAGMMGREIAIIFAKGGFDVALADVSMEAALEGKQFQAQILDREIAKGRLDTEQKEQILSLITPIDNFETLNDVDIVTECASENFEIKQRIFKKLDAICKESCIFLTNTSAISITKLSATVDLPRRKRFLGTHYFSPATVMKLVEIIPGLLCSSKITEEITALMVTLGKTPVLAKDVTGFVVNRIYAAILLEACKILEEGVATIEGIDTACRLGMGHPIGPFESCDNTSLSLNLAVQGELFESYGERFRPSPLLARKVFAGHNGKRAGEGFYLWNGPREKGPSMSV